MGGGAGMKLILLSLLLASSPAEAKDEARRLKKEDREAHCRYLLPKTDADSPPPPKKTEADGFHYSGDCLLFGSWKRVESNEQTKGFLKGLSKKLGQSIRVHSCFRSQEHQNYLLCKEDCLPYGKDHCAGKVAVSSEHKNGIAADMLFISSIPPNSPDAVLIAENRRLCRVLNETRKETSGGRGAIAVYGVNEKSHSYMHYDVKPDWCNWGAECVKELGDGFCKRKIFADKEAKMMQVLADAREKKARLDVMTLQRQLRILRADCNPGDERCRDLYKHDFLNKKL